jgi:hypothetical protein
VTGISAVFTHQKINSRIVLHKKSPLNKLLNKSPRISGKENNINKPLNNVHKRVTIKLLTDGRGSQKDLLLDFSVLGKGLVGSGGGAVGLLVVVK